MTSRTRSINPYLGLLHNKVAYILATRELIPLYCTYIVQRKQGSWDI